jgi:hypothetical protein
MNIANVNIANVHQSHSPACATDLINSKSLCRQASRDESRTAR